MKRTGEKTMMKTILLSAILLSTTNCINNVKYYKEGVQEGNITNITSDGQTTTVPTGVVTGDSDAVVDTSVVVAKEDTYEATSELHQDLITYYTTNPLVVTGTNPIVYTNASLREHLNGLSDNDLVLFEAMFRIASELESYPNGTRSVLVNYWMSLIPGYTYEQMYAGVADLQEEMDGFMDELSDDLSSYDLRMNTYSVVATQRDVSLLRN